MKRIIIHWTAGAYTPNLIDKEHYHYIIDAKGVVHNGRYTPEDNINCADGRYAAHTGGGNTGSIGVSMCGMAGFKSSIDVGKYPLTKVQCEACFKLCSDLCKKYNIPITNKTVLTHYEFGKQNPLTSSAGKIDIIYLPPYPTVFKDDVGNFIRAKIRWYSSHS